MAKKLTYAKYREAVESQTEHLYEALERIQKGELQGEIELPEGIESLTKLSEGIVRLAESLQAPTAKYEVDDSIIEARVAERTAELQRALEEARQSQSRSIREEWAAYVTDGLLSDSGGDGIDGGTPAGDEAWQTAISQAVDSREPALYSNGDQATTLAVPVNYADELIGVLGFSKDQIDAWDEDDLATVSAVAEQLGLALENQRLFDQTQAALTLTAQQAERLSRLNDFGALLNAATSIESVIEISKENVNPLVGSDIARLYLIDSKTAEVSYTDLGNDPLPTDGFEVPALENSASGIVIRSRQLVIFNDLHKSPLPDNQNLAQHGIQTRMLAPLITNAGIIGTLNVGSKQANAFSQGTQNLFVQLTALLAATIENQRLSEGTRLRAAQLEQLAFIETTLSQAVSDEEVVAALAQISDEVHSVVLQYIDSDEQGNPLMLNTRCHWLDGRVADESPLYSMPIPIRNLPSARLWLEHPNDPLIIEHLPRQTIVEEDDESDPRYDVESIAVLPLQSGGRWQGRIYFAWPTAHEFSETERFMFDRLLEPIAAVIARRRATEAQQVALAESETLYRLSAQLNAAETVVEISRAVASFGTADSVVTFIVDGPATDLPPSLRVSSAWTQTGKGTLPLNTHLGDAGKALTDLFSQRRPAPILFEVVRSDAGLSEAFKGQLDDIAVESMVWLPLMVGRQWLGMMMITWRELQSFNEQTTRIYGSLMGQTSIVMSQLQLLNQTRTRAEQLELLAQVEGRLSLIDNEHELVAVLSSQLSKSLDVELRYVEEYLPEKHILESIQARSKKGQLLDLSEIAAALSELPTNEWLLAETETIIYIEDVNHDPRVNDQMRSALAKLGVGAICHIPLLSAGQQQGSLVITAEEARRFSETERFLFARIQDSVGAVVAGQRASEAREVAQRETNSLYRASQRINEATTADEMLASFMEAVGVEAFGRAEIWVLDDDPDGTLRSLKRLAAWVSDDFDPEAYDQALMLEPPMQLMEGIDSSQPTYVPDVTADKRIDSSLLAFLSARSVGRLGMLPLNIGDRQIAVLMMMGGKPAGFDPALQRMGESLTPQIAIALENQTLLTDAQKRARHERVLREITARVRGSSNIDTIMRTAAKEIGEALGRRTFVYIDDSAEELSDEDEQSVFIE